MNNRTEVFTKIGWWGIGLLLVTLFLTPQGIAQEDKISQVAVEIIKSQMRLPKETEIKFLEKKESPIPDFYSIKVAILFPDREIPVVVYVDKAGEKIILGSLFVKNENMTRREAGEPKLRKIDLTHLEIKKSPSKGPTEAIITIVEFSNFECPYCVKSWTKMKEWIEKHPDEIHYVFKHFPLQGRISDLSEMAGAAQELGNEAFWVVHDFLFSDEGQELIKKERNSVKGKIEQMLKEKGFNVEFFRATLEAGKGRRRVAEDMALGNRIPVRGTPTAILNGELIQGPISDKVFEKYL